MMAPTVFGLCNGSVENALMRTFVLVHGSFSGGWMWRVVADELRASGDIAFAPTLTGLGDRRHVAGPTVSLGTHIQDVVNLL
jgi:hypothetical protein